MTGVPRLNAVDMSRWGGELTAAEASALRAAGVELVIVGTGNPLGAGMWARQQALAAVAAGMRVEAYIYLYMAGDAGEQVAQAVRSLEGVPVARWWLDAEDVESPELTVPQRRTFLHVCVSLLQARKVPVGIYTGRWWWVPNMGDYEGFAPLPLWNSWYDGDPDTDGLPYGGWTDSTIEQYQGTTELCGQSVDLNYAKDLEVAMRPDEVRAIANEEAQRVVGGLFLPLMRQVVGIDAETFSDDASLAAVRSRLGVGGDGLTAGELAAVFRDLADALEA